MDTDDIGWFLHSPRNITDSIYSFVWSEWFWFPRGYPGWIDFENREDSVRHPHVCELQLGLLAAVLLMLVRYALERCVLGRVALVMGLEYSPRAQRQVVLDQFYRRRENPLDDEILSLARSINWTVPRVRTWFQTKRGEKICPIKKFCECAWRIVHSNCMFIYGMWVIHDEPWVLDAVKALGPDEWPHHHLKMEFVVYYMIEFGFYISLSVSLNFDARRNDFKEQILHHTATIILLVLSWSANFIRLGLMVSIVHKPAEAAMQSVKMAFYLKLFKGSWKDTTLTVSLTLVWIFTKLVVYPLLIVLPLSGLLYEEWERSYPCVLVIHVCLVLIFFLNVFWTYVGLRTKFRRRYRGQKSEYICGDERDEKEKLW